MLSKSLAPVDAVLDRLTMYRLVVSYLATLVVVAALQSWRGALGFTVDQLIVSVIALVGVCLGFNALFAWAFEAPLNNDSALITGLILALIADPAASREQFVFLVWLATLAMASKYIVAWRKVHLFNPAAIALVLTGALAGQTGSWWISSASLTPYVMIGGILVVRKLRRYDLVWSFLWATMFLTLAWDARSGMSFGQAVHRGVLDSPVWFLGFVMLTEPVTLPPTRALRTLYGVLAGVLVAPQFHIGTYYLAPELGLVVANAVAFPFRSWTKIRLSPVGATVLGPGLVDFLYEPASPVAYEPGQYMEWTLDHAGVDARGKRRFFTLASSPTESSLRVGVKFADRGSSYKKAMAFHAQSEGPIVATRVAGDFTLPRRTEQKLAFIAGGIGVTPFRSMVKYMTDRHEPRDVVLIYANRTYDEILYGDVFNAALRVFQFRPVYALSDPASAPGWWDGERGRIDAAMIQRQIPDFRDRMFYVSGSPALVTSVQEALRQLGVKREIKTDYFSGLAA